MSEISATKSTNMPRVFFVGSIIMATLSIVGCGVTTQNTVSETSPVLPVEVKTDTVVSGSVSTVEPTPTVQQPTQPTAQPDPKPTSKALVYKDGTYSAVGNYQSPAGSEEIGVSITLKNDVIVDANVQPKATAMTSQKMQGMFADNYKPMVIGKKITDVHLTKVSGSSLTPAGFNDALLKVEAQAKAL